MKKLMFLPATLLVLSSCGVTSSPIMQDQLDSKNTLLTAQSNYGNVSPCQIPQDYMLMCKAESGVFISDYMMARQNPLFQKVLQNLGVTAPDYNGKVQVEWDYHKSIHRIFFPIDNSDGKAGIVITMSGPGSSLKTSEFRTGSIRATDIISIKAVRFDDEGTNNLQAAGKVPYTRGIVYDPAIDSVSTLIMDNNNNKIIGADYEVPTSVRPLSLAFPITDPKLSNYPIAYRRNPLSAQDLQSSEIIVNPIVPPSCASSTTSNGGMDNGAAIVCPTPPSGNTYYGVCPPDQVHTANVNSSDIGVQNTPYGQPCKAKYDKPAPVWYCPPVPQSMFDRLDKADDSVLYASAAQITADILYVRSKGVVVNAPNGACKNARNKAAIAKCGVVVLFDFVTSMGGVVDTGKNVGKAMDSRDQAVNDIASFRQSYPCKYVPAY